MAVAKDERLALIRRKNAAFDALSKATVAYQKRSRYGPLPAAWGVQLAELEVEYRRALRALDRGYDSLSYPGQMETRRIVRQVIATHS